MANIARLRRDSKMKLRFATFVFIPLLLLAWAIAPFHILAQSKIENPPKSITKESSFVVAGYIPDYQLAHWSGDVDSLTDLIYFGASVSKDGRFDSGGLSPKHAQLLKKKKEASGCRLLFTVGGWNKSQGFAKLVADVQLREQWIRDAKAYCLTHGFDGIDYDWEHPKGERQIESYAQLLTETHKEFAKHKLIVTVAIAGWQDLNKEAFAAVDRVHLMSYDHDFPHATMEKSKADVARLLKAGCPASKIVLGIPFYGRNMEGHAKSYAQLTQGNPLDSSVDLIDGHAINGPATVADKVRFARNEKLAGVMIWELGLDAAGANSLLNSIRKEASADR